jgi:hypothetical protein
MYSNFSGVFETVDEEAIFLGMCKKIIFNSALGILLLSQAAFAEETNAQRKPASEPQVFCGSVTSMTYANREEGFGFQVVSRKGSAATSYSFFVAKNDPQVPLVMRALAEPNVRLCVTTDFVFGADSSYLKKYWNLTVEKASK